MLGGDCVLKGLSAKDELGMWAAGKEEKGLKASMVATRDQLSRSTHLW